MNAKELRIGNYFIEERSNTLIKVIGLDIDNTITFSGKFETEWKAVPIILTKEWLKKFGFEKKEIFKGIKSGVFNLNSFEIGMTGDDFVRNLWTVRIDKKTIRKVRYVHQLQNLYFEITGLDF